MLVFVVFHSACANIQSGGDVAQGRQALFKGDTQTALAHFQNAAQIDPNYVYGTELREGVLSFLGRAQYLAGQLPQARQTLENVLAQHQGDNVARLYLGLTLARQGDQQRSLREIEAGMKGIHDCQAVGGQHIGEEFELDGVNSEVYQSNAGSLDFKFWLLREQPANSLQLPEDLETEDSLAQLGAGKIQATVADSNIVQLEMTYNSNIRSVGPLGDVVEIGWMMRKNQTKLKAELDDFMKKLYKGTFYNIIWTAVT